MLEVASLKSEIQTRNWDQLAFIRIAGVGKCCSKAREVILLQICKLELRSWFSLHGQLTNIM